MADVSREDNLGLGISPIPDSPRRELSEEDLKILERALWEGDAGKPEEEAGYGHGV